ncbi:MAG: ATP-binding protein [Desulfobacteraceae bacterium]|jgi:signal transduction histidine kinase
MSAAQIIPLLERLADTCQLTFELHADSRVDRIPPRQAEVDHAPLPEILAEQLSGGVSFNYTGGLPPLRAWGVPFTGTDGNPAWLLAHAPSLPQCVESHTIMPLLTQIVNLCKMQQKLRGEIDELATVLDQSFEELALYGRIDEVAGSGHPSSTPLPAIGAGLQRCLQADLVFVRIPAYPEMAVTIASETAAHPVGSVEAFIDELIRLTPMRRLRLEGDVYCLNNSSQDAVLGPLSKAPYRFMAAQCRFNTKSYGWIGAVCHDFENFFKRGQMRLLVNTAVQIAMLAAHTELRQGLGQLTRRVEASKRMMAPDAAGDPATRSPESVHAVAYLDRAFGQMAQSLESGKSLLAQSAQLAAVGQLAAIFAHEIKQPLTVLSGLTRLGMKEAGDPEEQSNMALIAKTVDRLIKMVKRFGSFSMPIRQEIHPVDLNEVVEEIFDLTKHQLLIGQIDGRLDLHKSLPAVMGDKQGIRQVILNLVSNAIHAMEPGGNGRHALRLRSYRQNSHVCLDVEDTGHGVDPAHILKLFDPYYSTKPPEKGTGLGLAVAKEIMEQIGGRIDLHSLPGKGSCFTLWFPCPVQDGDLPH